MTSFVLRVSSHAKRIAESIVISLPFLRYTFRPGGVARNKNHHYFIGSVSTFCAPSEKTIHEKLIRNAHRPRRMEQNLSESNKNIAKPFYFNRRTRILMRHEIMSEKTIHENNTFLFL